MKGLAFFGFLATIIAGAYGISCYVCSNCEKGEKTPELKKCHKGFDRCFKMVIGDVSLKNCYLERFCNTSNSGKLDLSSLSQMKDDEVMAAGIKSAIDAFKSMYKGEVNSYCCDTDNCNPATHQMPTLVMGIGLPILIASLYRY